MKDYYRPEGAVRWFAWRPVCLGGVRMVWLEWVWRIPPKYVAVLVCPEKPRLNRRLFGWMINWMRK